ncbi:hypothetical protein GEU84_017975 [Fertoebacter nigrum]|uniref:Uncharacterized protein n=1 Tax=Fertoeibacter niger TaxID=2656921 RepID=A0A8X8GXT1_9RHOB|nr:hypothetical protein [Fertoeibacter niger]NUB46284.1 hypothetical protein [Fertoeibacter niger]
MRIATLLLATSGAALLAATPLRAENLTPVQTAALSARVYDAGVAAKDPLLILAAAKLRKQIAPTTTDRAPDGGTVAEDTPLGWEDMLASAETLAADDDTLLGLIADLRVETTKGVVAGPVYNIAALGNGGTDTYPPIDFKGGEYAEVYVEAKAATDLNLLVLDAQGRLVCSDTDRSHIAYCGWRPADAGAFTFKVENKGPTDASYALMTN